MSVDAWGIQRDWIDSDDRPQTVADETVASLRAVIGTPPADLEERAPIVTRPGRDLGLGRVHVTCEDGTEHTVEGRMRGTVLRAPRGTGGFGYDPVFLPDGETRTTAEMAPEEKDAISHRGKAFRALAGLLPDALAAAGHV